MECTYHEKAVLIQREDFSGNEVLGKASLFIGKFNTASENSKLALEKRTELCEFPNRSWRFLLKIGLLNQIDLKREESKTFSMGFPKLC